MGQIKEKFFKSRDILVLFDLLLEVVGVYERCWNTKNQGKEVIGHTIGFS